MNVRENSQSKSTTVVVNRLEGQSDDHSNDYSGRITLASPQLPEMVIPIDLALTLDKLTSIQDAKVEITFDE